MKMKGSENQRQQALPQPPAARATSPWARSAASCRRFSSSSSSGFNSQRLSAVQLFAGK